jgi:hypothetical protein
LTIEAEKKRYLRLLVPEGQSTPKKVETQIGFQDLEESSAKTVKFEDRVNKSIQELFNSLKELASKHKHGIEACIERIEALGTLCSTEATNRLSQLESFGLSIRKFSALEKPLDTHVLTKAPMNRFMTKIEQAESRVGKLDNIPYAKGLLFDQQKETAHKKQQNILCKYNKNHQVGIDFELFQKQIDDLNALRNDVDTRHTSLVALLSDLSDRCNTLHTIGQKRHKL